MNRKPSFDREKQLLSENVLVFGMDEVGRGSFAGPLVAAAVFFDKEFKWFDKINDSKLLTHKTRTYLSRLISKNASFLIEEIDIETINNIGIEKSNRLAFKNLIKKIGNENKKLKMHFLIDGRKKNLHKRNVEFIIKGDQKHISIAAASIIAKVYRDNLMRKLGKQFPGYNFAKNKGYGTKFHREALKIHGFCEVHRTSFKLDKFL